jgi:hypothetical protein
MARKQKIRRNTPRSGQDGGGGGSTGGGGKRGIPIKGWEKGDIVRDMVVPPDGPQIPRKPGSRREDRTVEPKENNSEMAAASVNYSGKVRRYHY